MFTGIIENKVQISAFDLSHRGASIVIKHAFNSPPALGESIALNGVCLTVTEANSNSASFFAIPETLELTNLKSLNVGDFVNLERSLFFGDRLSGHLVQGHVDGMGKLLSIEDSGDSKVLTLSLSESLSRFCVLKGSITLNGVSLTLTDVSPNHIKVCIIPHTWEITNLNHLKIGDSINIETDMIAKHLEKLCKPYLKQ